MQTSALNAAFMWRKDTVPETTDKKVKTEAETINKRLDKIDEWLADGSLGVKLYQILSGSVRGPDNGIGKSIATNRLRRTCFPKTCANGNTGMCSDVGTPEVPTDSGASSHYKGHVMNAISYLKQIGRIGATPKV
jgi:hypothetical protein